MWPLTSTFEVLEQLSLDRGEVVVERRRAGPEPRGEATPGVRTVRKLGEYPRLRRRKPRQEHAAINFPGAGAIVELGAADHLVGASGAGRGDVVVARVVGQHEDQAVPHRRRVCRVRAIARRGSMRRVRALVGVRVSPYVAGMAIVGAEIASLTRLEASVAQQLAALDQLRSTLSAQIDATQWQGSAADRFRSQWRDEHEPALRRLAAALDEAGVEVARRRAALEAAGA